MFAGITTALLSIDQLSRQIADALHAFEPQIYAAILLIVLAWFVVFPPKNDPDQI